MSMKSSLNVWSDFDKTCFDYLGKGRLTEWTQGPSIKDVRKLGGERGQVKVNQCEWGGREWFANCGRSLGKKIIATILVKCTQII